MERGIAINVIYRALDEARWSKAHWQLFLIVSLNFFLDGIMFSIAPLLAYLIAPPELAAMIFAANLLAETSGAIILGYLADRLGRRLLFMVSLSIESASIILLFFLYHNPIAILVLTSLMTFGIGGEFGASYAAIAELSPAKHRGKALMLSTNFWNIGSAVIAGLALIYATLSEEPITQISYLLYSALATAIIVGASRIGFPESPRWLVEKGRSLEAYKLTSRITGINIGEIEGKYASLRSISYEKALGVHEVITRYWFRFLVLAVVTIAQYVTYDITAYYLPYARGFILPPKEIPLLIFIANIGASSGAFLLIPLIDRTRRSSVLAAFTGGFITAVVLLIANSMGLGDLLKYMLFINMVFSEWAWAGLSVLQSELFPTGVRATVVGLLTGLQGILGAIIVYLEAFVSAASFLAVVASLWFLGLSAALAWHARGIETAGKSLEETGHIE